MSASSLETLEACHAITQVLRRYCRAMDRIDATLGYTVWHEDGVADYGPIFKGSGRGFIDWACEYHRTLDAQSHQIANALIDVSGDYAASETYLMAALLFREDGQQRLTTARGRYLDRWSRRGGLWAIDERLFVLDFMVSQSVDAQAGWGIRDRTDPSYALLGALGAAQEM